MARSTRRLSRRDLAALAALPNINRRLAAIGQPWDGSACPECSEVHHPTQCCRPADIRARFPQAAPVAAPAPVHCHGAACDASGCDCSCDGCLS